MSISISCHDRPVTSPFGLVGNDENALTFALGYTLSNCPELLRRLLGEVGIKRVRSEVLASAEVYLQRYRSEGITDIEIHVPGTLFVVIEAKVGLSIPSFGQCQKYLPRFKEHPEPQQKLVALVEGHHRAVWERYSAKDERFHGVLTGLSWSNVLAHAVRLQRACPPSSDEGRWIRFFQNFADREYQMKCYTDEVWIVPASTTPLWPGGMSFLDTHLKGKIYYRGANNLKKPLYIAFRSGGKVNTIQRVLSIELECPPIKALPQLASVPNPWPNKNHTIWHLSEPTPLQKPIPAGDSKMRARHCCVDLDILLSCTSIRDAELRMKARRQGQG